jgi:hypothetical protein
MGISAPASSAAPSRAGRHSAAAAATATNATITTTLPKITGAGFEKILPAVTVWISCVGVRSV